MPTHLVFAGVFYSEKGIQEIEHFFHGAKIIVVAQNPDMVDSNGMLHPGIGNMDERMNEQLV